MSVPSDDHRQLCHEKCYAGGKRGEGGGEVKGAEELLVGKDIK